MYVYDFKNYYDVFKGQIYDFIYWIYSLCFGLQFFEFVIKNMGLNLFLWINYYLNFLDGSSQIIIDFNYNYMYFVKIVLILYLLFGWEKKVCNCGLLFNDGSVEMYQYFVMSYKRSLQGGDDVVEGYVECFYLKGGIFGVFFLYVSFGLYIL